MTNTLGVYFREYHLISAHTCRVNVPSSIRPPFGWIYVGDLRLLRDVFASVVCMEEVGGRMVSWSVLSLRLYTGCT